MDNEIKQVIKKLQELKATVGQIEGRELSDSEYCKRYLKFSSTTWSKLQTGSYSGNLSNVLARAQQSVEEIEGLIPVIEDRARSNDEFVRTSLAKAALSAIKRARGGIDNRRVVAILAPTGYGKSSIGEYLAARGAILVEGRQAWRSSYRAFCADVARAAGRKVGASLPEYRLEDEMISALSLKDGLLYIDEANTMSAAAANAIKHIVNVTDYTVVIAAIPEMWDKFLRGSRDEVNQLVNRCQPVLRSGSIPESDVQPFLEHCGLASADLQTAWKEICKAANLFGGFRTIKAIATRLEEIAEPTLEDVEREIRFHKQNIAAAGISL